MKTLLLAFKILFATLLLILFTTQPATAQNSAPEANTFLWSISKQGIPNSYLIGTIHIGKKNSKLPEKYLRSFKQTNRLVVESNGTKQYFNSAEGMADLINMIQLAQSPKNLSQSLGNKRIQKINQVLKRYSPTTQLLSPSDKWRPWFVMMHLEYGVHPSGYQDDYGIDNLLINAAQDNNKPIITLENSNSLKIFAQLPEDIIIRNIDAFIAHPKAHIKEFQQLTYQYAHQQAKALWQGIINAQIYDYLPKQDRDTWKNFNENILLKERNLKWIPILKPLLAQGNTTIAVGAGHLFGEYGLIHLLREEGYTVSPILN